MVCMLPAGIAVAASTEIYVSAAGNDARGNGSQAHPYATLSKAAEAANASASKTVNVYVMSDLTSTACARFNDHDVTIRGLGTTPPTIYRGDTFDTIRDNARNWYNPAMIEVQTPSATANLTLENIVLNDQFKHEGTNFIQAASGSDNTKVVQDAIIASNATLDCTITLGRGVELQNFGGMSAVRVTDKAKLVMKDRSCIRDTSKFTRTKETGDFGPAGAIWIQGAQAQMDAGSTVKDIIGRAVYVDSGQFTLGGVISNITGNGNMWQGKGGVAIHLRNNGKGTVVSTGKIDDISSGKDGSVIRITSADLDLQQGSTVSGCKDNDVIYMDGTESRYSTLTMAGEICNNQPNGNHVLQTAGYTRTTLAPTGNVHHNVCHYGTLYLNGYEEYIDLYGKLNNNYSDDRGGGLVLSNNGKNKYATMYAGAEICHNIAMETGGGVMVSCGKMIMNGGKISGNIAKMEGGGVYVRRGGQFVMNDGEITGNRTAAHGGGIAYDASEYNTWVPLASLNGGSVTGNLEGVTLSGKEFETRASGGRSNDLAIYESEYGHMSRYFAISDQARVGNHSVYMKVDEKTVAPQDSLPIKLGNASESCISYLKETGEFYGWKNVIASFWMQRNDPATFAVGSLSKLNPDLPVYALYTATDAKGERASSIKSAAKDDGMVACTVTNGVCTFSIPDGYANGCAIALVQPESLKGAMTLSGPSTLVYDGSASYLLPYQVKLSLDQSLASTVREALKGNRADKVWIEMKVVMDESLTAQTTIRNFTSEVFELDTYTVDDSELQLALTVKKTATADFASAAISFECDGKLMAKDFVNGKQLFTGGMAEVHIPDQMTLIPANVCRTTMSTAEETPVAPSRDENDHPKTGDPMPQIFLCMLGSLAAMLLLRRRQRSA